MSTLKTGDAVLIQAEGRLLHGHVLLASPNGVSLMIGFDALLDGHLGTMPVMRIEGERYHSIVTGIEIRLTLRGERDH